MSEPILIDRLTLYPGSDAHLLACTVCPWRGDPKVCHWCNGPLPGRRTRWCSEECSLQFGRQHWWSWARGAAMRRDDFKCVRCGTKGADFGIGGRSCQVHHKTPILGRHSESGCHHHLDGLETLCHPCHLEAHRLLRAAETTNADQLTFGDAA